LQLGENNRRGKAPAPFGSSGGNDDSGTDRLSFGKSAIVHNVFTFVRSPSPSAVTFFGVLP
jgi:hypothetical protein